MLARVAGLEGLARSGHLGDLDRRHRLERLPAPRLLLEHPLQLGEGGIVAHRLRLARPLVRPQVLLADGLEPLPALGGWPEHLSRHRHGFLEALAGRRGRVDEDPVPPFVVGCSGSCGAAAPRAPLGIGPHPCLELPHRHSPGPLDPATLGLSDRHSQHDLGLSRAHLAAADGRSEERPRPKLAGQPRHAQRGAAGQAQDLPGVVGEPGVAQTQHPVAHAEIAEPVADGDVEGAPAARHPGEQAVDEQGALPAVEPAPGLGNLELPGARRQVLEHHVE